MADLMPPRMVLCPTCGNKRCPHATDHRNRCTGSNAPGQVGYPYAAQVMDACADVRSTSPTSGNTFAAASARAEPTDAKCDWHSDDGAWHSACGVAYCFTDAGPVENGHRYCHACGKPLSVRGAK